MSCQCRIYTKYIENQGSFKYNTKEMWVSPSRSLVLSIPEAALGDVHTPLWNLNEILWSWNFDHRFSLKKDADWSRYHFGHLTHVYFTSDKLGCWWIIEKWRHQAINKLYSLRGLTDPSFKLVLILDLKK